MADFTLSKSIFKNNSEWLLHTTTFLLFIGRVHSHHSHMEIDDTDLEKALIENTTKMKTKTLLMNIAIAFMSQNLMKWMNYQLIPVLILVQDRGDGSEELALVAPLNVAHITGVSFVKAIRNVDTLVVAIAEGLHGKKTNNK